MHCFTNTFPFLYEELLNFHIIKLETFLTTVEHRIEVLYLYRTLWKSLEPCLNNWIETAGLLSMSSRYVFGTEKLEGLYHSMYLTAWCSVGFRFDCQTAVGRMQWPKDRCNVFSCSVRTSRQRSCKQRVVCLPDLWS